MLQLRLFLLHFPFEVLKAEFIRELTLRLQLSTDLYISLSD